MTVFGKPVSEYVRFTCYGLYVIAAVTILRMVLSLAGVSNTSARWVSGTVATLVWLVIAK